MAERDNFARQNIDFSGKNVDIDVRKSASLPGVGRGTRGTPLERKEIRVTEEGGKGVAGILEEEYKKQWDTVRRGLKKVAIGAAVAGIAAKAKKKSYLARQAAREEEARRQEEEYKKREALSSQGGGKEEKKAFPPLPEEKKREGEGAALPLPEGEEEGEGADEEGEEEEAPESEEEGKEEGEDITERIKREAEERGKKEIKRKEEKEFQKRLKKSRQPKKIAPKKPAKIKAPAKLRPRAAAPKVGKAAGGAAKAAGSALVRAGAAIVAGGGVVALVISIILLVVVLVVVIVFFVKAQKDCDSTASGQAFCSAFKLPGGLGYGNLGGPSAYGPSGETGEPNGWEVNLVAGQRDRQLNEADPRLIAFINCVHSHFPATTNAWQVTSLSDDAGFATCQGNNWTDPACAHGHWSCHYGGHNCDRSVAFDVQPIDAAKRSLIGDEIYVKLKQAAHDCNQEMNLGAGFLDETADHHIHLSVVDTECNCAENLTPP